MSQANDEEQEQREPPPPLVYGREELFQGRREIWIEHNGERYRLRITSRGRLILTK